MAYSKDLRQRVIDACDRGMTTSEVASTFEVSASWVRRLKQWRRERGDIMPKPCGGSKPKLKSHHVKRIHMHFEVNPHTTIQQLHAALDCTEVSAMTVWRKARELGYRFQKKKPSKSKR